MLITKNSSVPGNLDRAQNARRLEAFWVRCGQWKSGIFPLVTEQYVDEVVLHGLRFTESPSFGQRICKTLFLIHKRVGA